MMDIVKEYTLNYIKQNKHTSITILLAIFIATALISLTCGVFYNIWVSDMQEIRDKEGDWHGKLTGAISEASFGYVANHPNVEKVTIVSEENSEKTVEILFHNPRAIYSDLPQIARSVGISTDRKENSSIQYHTSLLSRYFIFNPGHPEDIPLVPVIYLVTMLIACSVLVLIIHNAFAVSVASRLHQLGILQSIGASPRQIKRALLYEAFLLSVFPLPLGIVCGWGLCWVFNRFINSIIRSIGVNEVFFQYGLPLVLPAFFASALTIWLSAMIPARQIKKMNPLDAIRRGTAPPITKGHKYPLLTRITGIEGELAKKSLYGRRKSFRTSTVSLTLSFLLFSGFMNMEAISRISNQITFFERYQDAWDLMITIENQDRPDSGLLTELKRVSGIEKVILYNKAAALAAVTKGMQSDELAGIGGLERLSGEEGPVAAGDGASFFLEAPIIALDDESFNEYCRTIGADASLFHARDNPGAIVVNTIWDNVNSDRRNKRMIPFLKLQNNERMSFYENTPGAAENDGKFILEAVFSTDKLPGIGEEFPNFSLVQIIPQRTYLSVAGNLSGEQGTTSAKDIYINILAASEEKIPAIAQNLKDLCSRWLPDENYTIEDKLQTQEKNDNIRFAAKAVIGCLAGLLALIGIVNVFANILGHLYQRYREIAILKSVGLSPKGIRKMLIWEAVFFGLYPVLFSLLINIPLVALALNASFITPALFLGQMQLLQIGLFEAVILFSVGLAYYIGGWQLHRADTIAVLREQFDA